MTLPVHIALFVRKLVGRRRRFLPQTVVGRGAKQLTIYTFNTSRPLLKNLSHFYHVLSGQMALVGTEMRKQSDGPRGAKQAYISTIKPGIFLLAT